MKRVDTFHRYTLFATSKHFPCSVYLCSTQLFVYVLFRRIMETLCISLCFSPVVKPYSSFIENKLILFWLPEHISYSEISDTNTNKT